jgi:hypothetical protein
MSNRGKTVKRSPLFEEPDETTVSTVKQSITESNNTFLQFLDANANVAYKRPWHRLERGLRLNRLRKFAEDETARFNLNTVEQDRLFSVLSKSLDKKLLNSKLIVNYDMEQEKILEIKGLVMHKLSDGSVNFQLTDRKVGATLKRKPVQTTQTNQSDT